MRKTKIEFFRHNINSEDIRQCNKVLKSIFLTTGKLTRLVEEKLAGYLHSDYSVGVSSCTDALFLSLKYFNIGPGDEVITTPLSFVSTANVIEHCGAKPVFVDVEPETGNIDASRIEKAITKKTKAIIPVHLYGQMCDMKAIKKIASKYKLALIEDSAHCIEGIRDNIRPGQIGDTACFSFYATKTITCGEGGAIVTKSQKIYEWLVRARLHGISKSAADRYTKLYQHYDMEFLGYKTNMTDIQASLLFHQIDRLNKLWQKRESVANKYERGFKNNPFITTLKPLSGTRHARYIFTILVNPMKRDDYLHQFQTANIGVAVNFRPIHLMKFYKEKYGYKPGDFPVAESIGNSTISIPLYPRLKDQEITYIIKTINTLVTS
jgi:dTDP-4-amino-4,6-dideoxygalactose transaminase